MFLGGGFLNNVFAVIMIVWASVFCGVCKRGSSRNQQMWGMKNWDTEAAPPRAEYTTNLEGTQKLRNRKIYTSVCVVIYCLCFSGLIAVYELMCQRWRNHGNQTWMYWQPYVL